MASYRGHLMLSIPLGAAYGFGAHYFLGVDWVSAALGGMLCGVSGLLPDLDSDSGMPVRIMFGLLGVICPLLMLPRLLAMQLPLQKVLFLLVGCHLLVRYGGAFLMRRTSVHRGMYHSIPAMLIAGLAVFLMYHHSQVEVRAFLAAGAMVGFLSHLVLDELCSVDFSGMKIKLNKFAGSAVKFASPSWTATLATYAILAGLAWTAAMEFQGPRDQWRQFRQTLSVSAPTK